MIDIFVKAFRGFFYRGFMQQLIRNMVVRRFDQHFNATIHMDEFDDSPLAVITDLMFGFMMLCLMRL